MAEQLGAGQPARTDTSDMLAVHKVFRDALSQAPGLVGGVGGPDRASVVADYYANVLRFLDVHHDGEDELLWPPLRERAGDPALVQRMSDQHHAVTEPRRVAGEALAAWTASPNAGNAAGFVAALGQLAAQLTPHLDEEELHVVPLAAQYLTPAEWGMLPEHGMRAFQGDKIWLILGLIRDRMSQPQRDAMLSHMPPPAAAFWTGTGEGLFRSYMAELGV